MRRADGSRLATYTVKGYFGALTWESERALLLDTYGAQRAATVRCYVGGCERATALRPATSPRSWG